MHIPLFLCMFLVCVFCMCVYEHGYIDVGQQGEEHKKEKGEPECQSDFSAYTEKIRK